MATLHTESILITSESGKRLDHLPNIVFDQDSRAVEGGSNVIRIFPNKKRQTVFGIGTSFTEASAFVLAHLSVEKRNQVMQALFSEEGANFSMARTPIGSCDFCVEGCYSYADVAGDRALKHFNISVDCDGFNRKKHPCIIDENFDLLPMIQQAKAIKRKQSDQSFRIVASAWTAPSWMKNIEEWYQQPNTENGYVGGGGELKSEYVSTYAAYLIKYLQAYAEQGIRIWGITPVNEPFGNNGQWESMHFSAETQKTFITQHLGPQLKKAGFHETKLLVYDHNRDGLEEWVDHLYQDRTCADYIEGAAVHWYESSYQVNEDIFERVHEKYPDCVLVHTEGCIDDLGNDAPDGVSDPMRYKESGWFDNDDFWWNDNATDWAYSVNWNGVNADEHPIYTPVHRYARNIIVSLNHWLAGWIDWNCVLDQRGGPNHVGNHCGAPVMVDVESSYVYYTPVFFILKQLSRSIRAGDWVVQTNVSLDRKYDGKVYACTTCNASGQLCIQILNTARVDTSIAVVIHSFSAEILLEANSLQTICVRLPSKMYSTEA